MINAHSTIPDRAWIALFDLDGTLTWRDTLVPYLAGFVLQQPWRVVRLWRVPHALYRYWRDRDRGALKSRSIRMIMGGADRAAVAAWSRRFVERLKSRGRFRPLALAVLGAHRAGGDRLILMSASPDLYVPQIGELLGFELTLCTAVEWQGGMLEGRLSSENCRGEEKVRRLKWLREKYPGLPIIAYGNSISDLDHMRAADRALLVNGNMEARRMAKKCGIEASSWT